LLESLPALVIPNNFKSSSFRCGPCVQFGFLGPEPVESVCRVAAKFRVDGKLALVPPHLVATVGAFNFSTANGHHIWFEFAVFGEYHGTPTPAFTFDGGIAE
jgi:hypothetical protein